MACHSAGDAGMQKNRRLSAILFSCLMISGMFACQPEAKKGRIGICVPVGREKASAEAPYLVTAVNETGPAYRAGIRVGDRIVRVNGVAVEGLSCDYIRDSLLAGDPGTTAAIQIERDGALRTVTVKRGR